MPTAHVLVSNMKSRSEGLGSLCALYEAGVKVKLVTDEAVNAKPVSKSVMMRVMSVV